MNKERAGDRVFADVDKALADRIVSRSMENSKKTAPTAEGNLVNSEIDGADDFPLLPEGALPLVKMAALFLALLVLLMLFLGYKAGDDD
jgi:hypothetical protein